MSRQQRIRPIDESLGMSEDAQPPTPSVRPRRISSLDGYHTPKSNNVRLKRMGWLLPGKKHLIWALLAVGAIAVWRNAPRSIEVQPNDRAVLPTAERMAEISGQFHFLPECEQVDKLREWGGEVKLRYRYVSKDPTQPEIKALCWLKKSVEDAKDAFRKTNLNTVFDWGIGGKEKVGLVELDEKDAWADESRIYRVELEGRVLGYSVTVRSGTRTLYAKIEDIVLEPWQVFQICAEMVERLSDPALVADLQAT